MHVQINAFQAMGEDNKNAKTKKLIYKCVPFFLCIHMCVCVCLYLRVCEPVHILQTWPLLSYGVQQLSDYSLIFYCMKIHSFISTAGLSLLITLYMEKNQGCVLDLTT